MTKKIYDPPDFPCRLARGSSYKLGVNDNRLLFIHHETSIGTTICIPRTPNGPSFPFSLQSDCMNIRNCRYPLYSPQKILAIRTYTVRVVYICTCSNDVRICIEAQYKIQTRFLFKCLKNIYRILHRPFAYL